MTKKILEQAQANAASAMGSKGRPSADAYGTEHHSARHKYDTLTMAEDIRLLREAGVVVVEGLATPASIAAQRATCGVTPIVQLAEPKPTKRAGSKGQATSTSASVPAGWVAVRVPMLDEGGKARDRYEALETLRDQPWFGQLESVGTGFAGGVAVHVFRRPVDAPDAKTTTSSPPEARIWRRGHLMGEDEQRFERGPRAGLKQRGRR